MRQLMKDGENRAVRTFLQLIYGGVTGSITTKRMREHLEESEFDYAVPEWAKVERTLTKEAVQDWLRFLFMLETDSAHVISKSPSPALFHQYQTLVHVRTGRKYCVLETPEQYRIESTGEAAYAYRGYKLEADGRYSELPEVWVRCQAEMEDGRFIIEGRGVLQSHEPGKHTVAAIKSITTERTRGTPS